MNFLITLVICIGLFMNGCLGGHSKEEWKSRTIYQLLIDRFAKNNGGTSPCYNFSAYCGGGFVGLKNNLDYIEEMGFDAIWISPVISNTYPGYHGYHANNFYTINSHFGTEQELHDLINECHSRNIWVMLDVVANHVGPVGYDFSQITPFDRTEHYHRSCRIDYNNQTSIEYCRLADLPDLDDDGNSWVRSTLMAWVRDIVANFHFDGIRIDTVKHMNHGFWKDFTASAAVYSVGECLNDDIGYVFGYLDGMDGMLNYPLRSKFYSPFKNGSFKGLGYGIQDLLNYPGSEALDYSGNFVDNHDKRRFLFDDENGENRFMGALAFTLMFKGIPIVYYGSEQGFAGGEDPDNRETLWTDMNPTHPIYQFLKTVISTRKKYEIWNKDYKDIWREDNSFVFSRGEVVCIFTNGDKQQEMEYPGVPYSDGQRICNVFDGGDCITVSGGKIRVSLPPDSTKIYVPA